MFAHGTSQSGRSAWCTPTGAVPSSEPYRVERRRRSTPLRTSSRRVAPAAPLYLAHIMSGVMPLSAKKAQTKGPQVHLSLLPGRTSGGLRPGRLRLDRNCDDRGRRTVSSLHANTGDRSNLTWRPKDHSQRLSIGILLPKCRRRKQQCAVYRANMRANGKSGSK
jgi:hypothetical protein